MSFSKGRQTPDNSENNYFSGPLLYNSCRKDKHPPAPLKYKTLNKELVL